MDVPKNPDNTGWYSFGAQPGRKGSAVLAGHLDWYKGQTGVFRHLAKLKKGDIVLVETDTGKIVQFVVRETRRYDSEAYAPEVFQMNNGIHLILPC